ncbi:hypothetical protein [Paenochrobactrum glaciei]|uniref:Arc family DNA-binding protein n=1 Tax=Paenochrobactrum glaciei TaxID=486407 RepID=A0ABN1FNA9_9HYPH
MAVDVRITLRLPLAVHTALKKESEETNTSLNQLIVDLLNQAAGSPYRGGTEASVADRVDLLESEVEALRAQLRDNISRLDQTMTDFEKRIQSLEVA